MVDAVAVWKYLGIFGMLIAAGFGFPMPEEIPIVTAGALVGHDVSEREAHAEKAALDPSIGPAVGLTRWWIMLPVCILGVVLGDFGLYLIGRYAGTWLLERNWVKRKILPPDKRAQIEANFAKRGVVILLAARLTPGIRSPVFLMAGVLRMPFSRFLLADGLYAIPGVNILFWLAYGFTDQFKEAVETVDRHRPIAIAALLAAIGGFLLYKYIKNRKVSTGDIEEIPTYVKPVGAVTQAVEVVIEKTVGRTIEKTIEGVAVVLDKVTHPLGHGHATHPPHSPEKPPVPKSEANPSAATSPPTTLNSDSQPHDGN